MNDTNENLNNACEATGSTSIKSEYPPSVDTMIKKVVGIYGLQNKLKLSKWNIGQSLDVNRRFRSYKRGNCLNQPKIYQAIKKYGYEGFNKVILENCPQTLIDKDDIREWLDERESFWIEYYSSIESGYNIKTGGSNGVPTKETCQKISKALMGRKRSEETKKKISETLRNGYHPGRGKPIDDITKDKISKSLSGKNHYLFGKSMSEETKKKISDSRMGEKNWNFGKHRTNETKLKISVANQRRKL